MDLPDEFMKHLVDLANESTVTDTEGLKNKITGADLVFGVWQDTAQTHGVGCRVIKGQHSLAKIEHSKMPESLRLAVIPCREPEEAEAMRELFGDGATEH